MSVIVTHLWENVKKVFNELVDFFSKTLSWWFTLIGLILIIIGGTHPWGLSERFSNMFSSIGSAVLVGGVFGVLLKSVQYLSLFEDVLRKIFLGDKNDQRDLLTVVRKELHDTFNDKGKTVENSTLVTDVCSAIKGVIQENHFLQQRKDLKELWETITVAVYKTKYGKIGEDIAVKLTAEYLPQVDSFYYEIFQENITSLRFVKPDNKYIETTEVITLRVKPIDSSQSIDWKYVARLYKDPTDTGTNFFVDKITINDSALDYTIKAKDITDKYGRHALEAPLTIKLEGAMQYDLRLHVRRIYDFERNRQRDMRSSRFIMKPEFRVAYNSDELAVTFLHVGTKEDDYTNKAEDFSNVIWNEYKDLIFPDQGYTLLLDRKEASPMSKDTIRV